MPLVAPAVSDETGAGGPDGDVLRRSVVPPAAGRSLWLAASWTGAGAALLCAVVSIAVVAVCWLPASGSAGSAGSAIRAGILTFLAALHAGIIVDGVPSAFVPLGMTILVGLVAWRAGTGLADAADALNEGRPRQLVRAGALQAGVFAALCTIGAAFATLGSSGVPALGVFLAAFVLFTLTGGAALVRWSPLAGEISAYVPGWAFRVVRAAAAGVAVLLAAGAVLVAGAALVNHDRVEALSRQVGGGWSGVPVLLLGVLAAPNAAIAGASYLAGPGFALGTGSHVSLFSTANGTLPAFPVLGAVPDGHGAPWPVWLLAAALPVLAGGAVAAALRPTHGWAGRFREAALAACVAGVAGAVLAWQGGGAISSGRLNAIGASPWQFGLAVGVELGLAATFVLGLGALVTHLRHRAARDDAPRVLRSTAAVFAVGVAAYHFDTTDTAATAATAATTTETTLVDADTNSADDDDDADAGSVQEDDGRDGDQLAG